jgi:O-antigen/teichoic acid export membrane protein
LLATGLVMMPESFRDFGVSVYLIQERNITRNDVRTAFTITLGLSLGFSGALFASAYPVAALYGDPRLATVLQYATVSLVLAAFGNPITALLRRNMAFDSLAVISVTSSTVNCVLAITLAMLGFGYMSMVWSALIAILVSTIMLQRHGPGWWMFKPTFAGWRKILAFGGYSSLTTVLNTFYVSLPTLLLGRTGGLDAVGLYNRSIMLCQLPERMILSALQPVILPALSARVHAGESLKEPYLRGLSFMAAVQWPFLVCLALLADPIVNLALGPGWSAAASLVRLMAIASMSLLPAFMTFPVLVSVGRVRDTLTASLISLPPSMLVVCSAAFLGAEALAASLFITGPLQIYVAMCFIRRHVPFTWGEAAAAVSKGAVISLSSAAAPVAAIALFGFQLDLSVPTMIALGLGAAAGWVAGVYLTGHSLMMEIRGAIRIALSMVETRTFLRKPM